MGNKQTLAHESMIANTRCTKKFIPGSGVQVR